MATEFEIWLVGDEGESLSAIGEAALDEVERVESVLSRFDPAAELARFNRHAATSARPMKLSIELFEVLQRCVDWYRQTDGYFDIGWQGDRGELLPNLLELDSETRTASSSRHDLQLDLGGFGKGYALDCAARVVRKFGVASALMHGGTSSVLAIGGAEQGEPWPIALRDPLAASPQESCGMLALRDAALSSSADARSGFFAPDATACTVVCDSAADAEVFSTTFLGMGKERAKEYLGGWMPPLRAFAWIENYGGTTKVDWIVGGPHA